MSIQAARTYPGISAKAYEHPADRAATAALQTIPYLDRVLKRLSDLGIERRHRQLLLGNSIQLGADQLPSVWELHTAAASCLDIPVPPLYVTQTPNVQGLTIGANRPVVVVSSGLVGDCRSPDLHVVLAHEQGHVLSEHYYYTGVLYLLGQLVTIGTFPVALLAGLPIRALYYALLEWSRAAELSSDRAAAIVLGDPLAVCGALMRVAGGPLADLNLQAFLRQATTYVDEEDLFSRRARFGVELAQTHPFAVRRVKELMDWVSSGDFDRIVSGSYVRRGEEPPVSAQFERAVEHYRTRFTAMIDRTVGGVGKLTDQIQTWLRRNPPDPHEAGDTDVGGMADGDTADGDPSA